MDGNFSTTPPQSTNPEAPNGALVPDAAAISSSSPDGGPADRDAYWANIISGINSQKTAAATGNIVAAQGANPENAAMAQRLAPVLGIPAASIEGDPNFWQGQFDTRAARAAMSTDDNLKTWLATDQMNAKLAQGDIPHLNAIGKLFNGIGQGWSEGMLGGRAGWLEAKEQYLGLSPQQTDLLQTYREQMAAMQQQNQRGFAASAGRVIGGFPASVVADAPTVAIGAGAGAVVGGLTAGPLGILPGAFTGGNAAFAASQGVQASGEIYDQLSNTTDQYGRPIPEATKQAVSALGGLGIGALNMVGGHTLSATAKAAAGATLKDMAVQAAMRPGLAAGLTRTAAALVKSSATGAVLNSGMGAIQSLAPQLAEAMTSPNFATVFNDPAQRQQWITDRLHEAELGGATFPLLEMPGHLAGWWADAARASKAGADTAAGTQLADAVAQSKTVQRAPEAAAGLLNKYAQSEGIDNIYIPGDKLAELYQGMQTRPGAPEDPFGFVPDMQEQLSQAQMTGGDVEIPTGNFLAHLAGTDIERNLRPDIRWGADAMTARESADFHASNFPDLMGEQQPATGDEAKGSAEAAPDAEGVENAEGAEAVKARGPAAEAEQVKYDLKQQLMRAGMTSDQAEQNAAVSTSIFRTLAQRGGISPMDLYRQFGPVVQRDIQRFGPGNYGPMDEVIDSLRRGDKMPSDKQLYGDSLLDYLSKGENSRGRNMAPLSPGGKRAQAGGLVDDRGELAAMDADKWRRGQPGRRKLLNPDGMRLEEAAQRAHEAGYFPDHTEAPDTNEFLDAIRNELHGSPVYKRPTAEAIKREEFRSVRGQLEQLLHERGIDVKTASNAEVKAALDNEGKAYQQGAPVAKITGEEIVPKNADIKTLRDAARKYYDNTLRGHKVFNASLGKDIEFRSAKKAFATSADPEKLRLFSALRDVVENGRLIESTPPKDVAAEPSTKAYHFIEAPVDTPNGVRTVGVTIREDSNGHLYYNHAPIKEIRTPGTPASAYNDGLHGAQGEEGKTLKQSIPQDSADINVSLSQPDGAGVRGSIRLGGGKPVIALFKEADPSTFMHEMGHLVLGMVSELATREDAANEIKEMAGAVHKWLGIKSGEMPTVEQHEQFARGFETYLMTGKAPSVALQSAFRKFAAWLTKIYRDVKALGVPISDEVRGIMDRLVATDEEIAEAKQIFGMNPLFRTPEEAGMTIDMFNRYTARVNQEQDAFYAKALKRNMRAEDLKRRKEYKAEADAVRPEIEQQVKGRPVLKAWYQLRYGKDIMDPERDVMAGKLSTEAAKEMLGTAYQQLPRDITAPDGFHPDMLAESFGYDSGEAMLRDLVNENTGRQEAIAATGKPISLNGWIKRLVDQSLDDHLQNEFGSKLADDGVEQAAIDATESEGRMDIMATELRALANQAGIEHPQLSVQVIKQLAKDKLAEMPIAKATNATRYRRDEAKAARDAERALLAGKHIYAWKAKQKQMAAHAFAEEAQRLSDTFERTTKRWRVTAKNPTRAGTAQPFLDQVHGILDRLGVNVRRDPGELARALDGKSLESFLTSQTHQGYPIQVPSFMLDARFAKHYADLNSTEFEATRDAITSLLHVGRTQGEIQLQGRRADLQEEVDAAADMMERLPDVAVTERLNPGKTKDLEAAIYNAGGAFRTGDAALVKMEQLYQDYGGQDAKDARSNPFLRVLDRLKEGQHANDDRQVEMATRYRALKDQLPTGFAKSLRSRIDTPELVDFRTGRPMRMTRDELIGLMLNMGNESNFKKLYEGYKWSPKAVEAVVSRLARPEDVTFVNAIHGFMRDLFPEIDAMQRRVTGIGMGRFDDTPRDLPAGRLTGGYYPIDYDPVRAPTERARMNAEGVFDENYRFATTPKGHTIARTDYVAPLRLGTSYISRAIGQQIHDLSFREPIQDAVKFFNHPAIVRLMKEKSGPEYQRLVTDWLRYAANATNVDDKALGVIDNFFRYVRIGGSVVGIGFRASTLLKHGSSALVNSVGEVGGRELLAAARDIYRPGGDKLRAWIMENSGELRHRQQNLDRDARTQFAAMMGEKTWIATIQHYGFWPVTMADMGSAMPTWLAAQRTAMNKGMSAAEAFAEADRAVRNAHGAGGALDLAAIQRPTGRFSELMKCWTMFYGFFDHMYNRGVRQVVRSSVSGVRNVKDGDYVGAKRDFVDALGRTFWYIAMPAMIEATVAGTLKEAWDNEDTNWFEWGAKAILGQVAASIPIVRDVAAHELEGYDFDPSPLSEMVKNSDATARDIASATGISDKSVSNRWLEHAANTAGYLFHLPLGQVGTTAQYLWDFSDGTVDPQTAGEFMAGVMRGPPKGQ